MENAEKEGIPVAAPGGTVFVGHSRQILMTTDHLNWHQWWCPLDKVVALDVDDGVLAAVGDGQLAVSMVKHQGKVWQMVDVGDEPTCVAIRRNRVMVGTYEGRLFVFRVKVSWGLLEWLGFSKTAPALESEGEFTLQEECEGVRTIWDEWPDDAEA